MYARERARSAETYLLLRVEHHVDRLGARAPGLERGARPADVDDTCHDARKSRINAREGRRRNSLGAGSDEPHARAVRGERPRERRNPSPSHASADGVTTRARAACVRVMVRARRAGRFKYNRGLSKVSRVARSLKCRSKLASLFVQTLDVYSSGTRGAAERSDGGGVRRRTVGFGHPSFVSFCRETGGRERFGGKTKFVKFCFWLKAFLRSTFRSYDASTPPLA